MGAATTKLLTTDPRCLYVGRGTKLDGFDMGRQPIFLVGARVHWAATNWLRLLRENGRAPSTIETYRAIVLDFLLSVHDSGLSWEQVDNGFLIQWRRHLVSDRGITEKTFNGYLHVVISLYRWAQSAHWIENVVGEEKTPAGHQFPIRLMKTGRSGTLVSTLRFATPRQTSTTLPDESVLEDIEIEVSSGRQRPELAERDLIMIEWMRKVGLRPIEVLDIQCSQIPNLAVIERLLDATGGSDEGEPVSRGYRMTIRRAKRGGRRPIHVPLELLQRTREWIDGPRRAILQRKRSAGYRSPPEVFISHKTGQVLKRQALTNMYISARNKAARNAVVRKAVVHSPVQHAEARLYHLRHRAITDQYVERRLAGYDEDQAKLLVEEFAGHQPGSTSTDRYIHIGNALLPKAQTAERQFLETQRSDVRARWDIGAARIRIGKDYPAFIHPLEEAIAEGFRPEDMEEMLRRWRDDRGRPQ